MDGSEKVPIMAMIDSGTDGTVLHADIAEALKIDGSAFPQTELGGIGTSKGFVTTVKIVAPDFNMTMEVPVIFAKPLPLDGLLGQRHFFSRFKIRFEKDKNKFYMAPVQGN